MPTSELNEVKEPLETSHIGPKQTRCRACLEPIEPKASICKTCLTPQRYPHWIGTLAPGLGLLLALLSIASLILNDLLNFAFPQRGSASMYLVHEHEADQYKIVFANIGAESVTIEPEINCSVFLPLNYQYKFSSDLPGVFPLTFVRPLEDNDEPIILFPNERQTIRFEVRDFTFANGNPGLDALAFQNMKMSWASRQGDEAFELASQAASALIEDQDDFFRMIRTGVPEVLDPPFVPMVRDPISGENVVWRCEARSHDRYGSIASNPIMNPYVEATVVPSEASFHWLLEFSGQEPLPFNPETTKWGSSCGGGTDSGCRSEE